MTVLSVIVAAAAAWVFGAVWYMALARRWMAAAGLRPETMRRRLMPFAISAVLLVLVAGMMRHVLASSGITAPLPAMVTGLGLGVFIAAPWIAMNNLYADRPTELTLIDGGYAALGSAIIAGVLTAF